MKRKTWRLAVGMLGFVWMLGGCAQQSSEAAEEPEPVQEENVSEKNAEGISGSEKVNIQPGRYIMEHGEEWELFVPTVRFYKNQEFSFNWSLLSSYYAFGTYEIKDDNVILKTDDGEYQYTFRLDGEFLVFDQEHSSEVKTYEGDLEVADGAVFRPEGDLIAQNISFTLPDGLTMDPYDPEVGYAGGCLLLPEAYEKYDKDATSPEWAASGTVFRFSTDMITWNGDAIERVDVYWNHTIEEALGSVSGMAAPAYMMKMQHDLYTPAGLSALEERGEEIPEEIQSEYWYVFMANPEDEIGYAVSLNTKDFGKEDILEFAESIQYK